MSPAATTRTTIRICTKISNSLYTSKQNQKLSDGSFRESSGNTWVRFVHQWSHRQCRFSCKRGKARMETDRNWLEPWRSNVQSPLASSSSPGHNASSSIMRFLMGFVQARLAGRLKICSASCCFSSSGAALKKSRLCLAAAGLRCCSGATAAPVSRSTGEQRNQSCFFIRSSSVLCCSVALLSS